MTTRRFFLPRFFVAGVWALCTRSPCYVWDHRGFSAFAEPRLRGLWCSGYLLHGYAVIFISSASSVVLGHHKILCGFSLRGSVASYYGSPAPTLTWLSFPPQSYSSSMVEEKFFVCGFFALRGSVCTFGNRGHGGTTTLTLKWWSSASLFWISFKKGKNKNGRTSLPRMCSLFLDGPVCSARRSRNPFLFSLNRKKWKRKTSQTPHSMIKIFIHVWITGIRCIETWRTEKTKNEYFSTAILDELGTLRNGKHNVVIIPQRSRSSRTEEEKFETVIRCIVSPFWTSL